MLNRNIPPTPTGWTLAATGKGWVEFRRAMPNRLGRKRHAVITVHDSGNVYGRGAGNYLRQYANLDAAVASLNPHCEES